MIGLMQEWILKSIMELGFKQEEAQIYLLLYRDGSKRAKDNPTIIYHATIVSQKTGSKGFKGGENK